MTTAGAGEGLAHAVVVRVEQVLISRMKRLVAADERRQQKGLKMAGRMGNDQTTLHNREVIKVDTERNLIAIKGPIAGPKNGIVVLRKQS